MPPARHWRSYGTDPLPSGTEALDQTFAAFPSWFLRINAGGAKFQNQEDSMTIDVQSSEKEGTKDYAAVAQAIVLARRPDGVWLAELTKLTGMKLSRWGTRMCHHPDWGKGHKLISTQHTNGQWHFQIVPI